MNSITPQTATYVLSRRRSIDDVVPYSGSQGLWNSPFPMSTEAFQAYLDTLPFSTNIQDFDNVFRHLPDMQVNSAQYLPQGAASGLIDEANARDIVHHESLPEVIPQATLALGFANTPNEGANLPAPEDQDNTGHHRRETERRARNKMQKAMDDVHTLLAEHHVDKKGRADAIISLVLLCRTVLTATK